VKPMFGSAILHTPNYENSIKVTTEKLNAVNTLSFSTLALPAHRVMQEIRNSATRH
jgi:hypothetical protein